MKKSLLIVAALAVLAAPVSLWADPIPVPPVGENLATYTFTATANGPVVAYFVGQSAEYGSDIGLLVNNVSEGIYGLQNHTAVYGTMFTLTTEPVSAGDLLEFELRVSTGVYLGPPPVTYSLYSTPSRNSDGKQHVWSTPWAGDGAVIPAGIYVGFEDILGLGDKDYNDHQFLFTNVGASVPDGGFTLTLLGAALAGIGMLRRKLS